MKYLIVGLGNIGEKYINTRHNIGFKIADHLASLFNVVFHQDQFGYIAKFNYRGKKIIILKPNTYMNLSGHAVHFWVNYEKISTTNLMILSDDLHLNFGLIRIRASGSSGGHNGLKNIEKKLLTKNYSRLRFGIGNQFDKENQINYVLGNWNNIETKMIPNLLKKCSNALKLFIFLGLDSVMNIFNKKNI